MPFSQFGGAESGCLLDPDEGSKTVLSLFFNNLYQRVDNAYRQPLALCGRATVKEL